MSTRIFLQHQTKYSYDRPVFLSPHLLRLKPAAHAAASVKAYSLNISAPNSLHWQQDPFGNFVARADFDQAVTELKLDVNLLLDISVINPFDFFIDSDAQFFPVIYETQLRKHLAPYLEIVDRGPLMQEWLNNVDKSNKDIISFLVMINQKIYNGIRYTMRMEAGVQTSEETLQTTSGSCRDFAWLLVQVLRNMGLASRFVSGYLIQLSGNFYEQDLPDNVALHAWAEAYIPGAGWIGLDPTGGLLTAECHIPLACTPDAEGAAPVTGNSWVADTVLSYKSSFVTF